MVVFQADLLQRVHDDGILLFFRADLVDSQAFGNRFADRDAWIKRSIRILEDDLHVAAHFLSSLPLSLSTSSPLNDTAPEVGSIKRSMVRPTVVLPQPDSPTSPRVSPSLTVKADIVYRLHPGHDALQ